jgi:tetratricopeptide (TPR) repeat protein
LTDADRAVALNPEVANIRHTRARIHLAKGQLDPALADFDKALSLDPNSAGAYADRGRAYALKDERDKAIADYQKALSLKSQQRYDDEAKSIARRHLTALGIDGEGEAATKPERSTNPSSD